MLSGASHAISENDIITLSVLFHIFLDYNVCFQIFFNLMFGLTSIAGPDTNKNMLKIYFFFQSILFLLRESLKTTLMILDGRKKAVQHKI